MEEIDFPTPKSAGKKVKVTFVIEYEPDLENYRATYNEKHSFERDRTDAELNNLTIEEIIELDKVNLEAGDFTVEEMLEWDDDTKITWEAA